MTPDILPGDQDSQGDPDPGADPGPWWDDPDEDLCHVCGNPLDDTDFHIEVEGNTYQCLTLDEHSTWKDRHTP